MKVSAEQWREVEPLLSAALDMEAGVRAAWLADLEARNPSAAPVLRELMRVHERAERSDALGSIAPAHTPERAPSPHREGDRFGPFALLRRLGRGGMGEVWLARQVDGRVRRDVALKLPAMQEQHGVWRERFRRERDILARLEHPNIARLYDAGVAESGQPWLAMEYVAGMTLSAHVASRPHSIAQRLALFRQVLSAVAHAHRHLVVHRDLKPANVLVDAEGTVKLLDFGIAKLVEDAEPPDASGELTRMGGRVMTLRYAAPEQVSGGAISTATDIYALGVMLHELLTGVSPYRAVRDGKPLTESSLLDPHWTVPSRLPVAGDFAAQCGLATPRQLARRLSGDLDAIVLKAMRREPPQRYASVELFDADVAAHLQRRPVKARAGTWRYLGGRFAARHKLPLALAASVLATLVAGLVMVEGERRHAVAEKARAERHLASVRQMANTLIFDIHERLEKLPGSLPVREALVATSIRYLDALVAEPGSDPTLLLEAAAAYRSIGSVQGQIRSASRANFPAAIANLEKAAALLARLEQLKPGDVGTVRESWRTSFALAEAHYVSTSGGPWREEFARAIRFGKALAAVPGASHDDRAAGFFAQGRYGFLRALATGHAPEFEADMRAAIAGLEGLRPGAPSGAVLHERLATLYANLGLVLTGPGAGPSRNAEGVAYMEKALDFLRELRADAPNNDRLARMERIYAMNLSRELAAAGDLRRASRLVAQITAASEQVMARDPEDIDSVINHLAYMVSDADIANRLGEHGRAIATSRAVLERAQKLPKESVASREVRTQVAEATVILGYALVGVAERPSIGRQEALAALAEAQTLFQVIDRYIEEVHAKPTLGAIPEYKLREFAAARVRLERALRRHAKP